MTLLEFLNHIKHKSLFITLMLKGEEIFTSSIGVYEHWILKPKYDNYIINNIDVMENHFVINLMFGCDTK